MSYLEEGWTSVKANPSPYKLYVSKEKIEHSNIRRGKLVIIIDPTDVFMWETEHPEWDYFDRRNDTPNSSIGKDLKIYLPRIKIRVE